MKWLQLRFSVQYFKFFLDNKFSDPITKCTYDFNPEYFTVYLKLPYLGDVSSRVKGIIETNLRKLGAGGIKLKFT